MKTTSSQERKRSLNLIIILGVGILLFLIFFLILTITFQREGLSDVIKGIISFLGAIVPATLLFIKEYYHPKNESKKHKEKKDSLNGSFDILLFGHSGSGKTTFIQKVLTHVDRPIKSTKTFDYYEAEIPMGLIDLKNGNKTHVRITDYKGQDVTQILEGARANSQINAILFFADLAPAYSAQGVKLTFEDIIKNMSDNFEKEFINRVNTNRYKYLSEFLLQAVFTYSASDSLRSVRLIINKFDILETLQKNGIIDKSINLNQYVLDLYSEPILHIKNFCSTNKIYDFQTYITSVTDRNKSSDIFSSLLK